MIQGNAQRMGEAKAPEVLVQKSHLVILGNLNKPNRLDPSRCYKKNMTYEGELYHIEYALGLRPHC